MILLLVVVDLQTLYRKQFMEKKLSLPDDLFYNFNLLTDYPTGYNWETYFVAVENSDSGLIFARILSCLSENNIQFEIVSSLDKESPDEKIANFRKIILGLDLTNDEVTDLIGKLDRINIDLKISYNENLLTLETGSLC